MLAGVASGLGERFDLNPWWFRLGFVCLTPFGFAGVALYVVAWLLVSNAAEDDSIVVGWLSGLDAGDPAAIGGIVLIGVAVLILVSGIGFVPGRYAAAALLLIVGALLYRGELPTRSRGASDDPRPVNGGETESGGVGPAAPADTRERSVSPSVDLVDDAVVESADEMEVPLAESQSGRAFEGGERPPPPSEGADAPVEPRRRPARQTSVLGRATLALVFMIVGGLTAADAAGWLHPEPVHYLATLLAMVGLGLLVGAVIGRARGLIIVGVLLIPPALVASVVPNIDFTGEVGERHITVTTGNIDGRYRLAAGSLTVDFRSVSLAPQEDVAVEIEVGAGELIIIVPPNAGLRVEASVGIGSLDLLGRERDGVGLSDAINESGNGTLVINARTGFGTVSIVRAR